MKKKLVIIVSVLLTLVLALSLVGCIPEGARGRQGTMGQQGSQGVQGIRGQQGPEGPRGKQGEQGEQGEEGEQGERGKRGHEGDEGDEGDRGLRGYTGPAGSDAEIPTPTIDGVISSYEWYSALWFDEILPNTFTNPSVMSVRIYVTNDAENLYIALVLPDTYDMRDHPEVAEGGSDTFGLNIGIVGEERSYSRILQFNTTDRTGDSNWHTLDGYFVQWAEATSSTNTSQWGPDVDFLSIPAGVQSETIFNETCRVQEISIPLSDLDVTSGTLLRIGGCIRAAEYEGYNFHALYPTGLGWGAGETYKTILVR